MLRVILIAILAVLGVSSAAAERVQFGAESAVNAVSGSIETCPTMTFTPDSIGTGAISIYGITSPSSVAATVEDGEWLGQLTSSSSALTKRISTPYVALVVDTVETQGTAGVDIACSHYQSDSTVDVDGDGIYEFVRLPQDFDGDGTTWKTCDCGGGAVTDGYDATYICGTFRTSDTDFTQFDYSDGDAADNPTECRFHGQRVWDDFTDDLNAIWTQTDSGTEYEIEAGTLALKGGGTPTSDDTWSPASRQTSCWDSTEEDYTDTCQTNDEGAAQRKGGVFPHSGTTVVGAGVDPDGDKDLQYTGTVFVSNNGPREWWANTTVGNAYIQLGRDDVIDGDSGEVLTTLSYTDNRDPGTLCIENRVEGGNEYDDNWVTDHATAGKLYVLTSSHPNGAIKRTFARISEVTATSCDSGNGLEVVFSGATPEAEFFADNTIYQGFFGLEDIETVTGAEAYVTGPVDEAKLSTGIDLSGVWFTHLDYVGAGGCAIADPEAAACDNGSLLKLAAGFGHRLHNIGLVQTHGAFGSGQIIDSGVWSSGSIVENSLFRYNQGGLIDIPRFGIFRNNTVSDNNLVNNATVGVSDTYYTQLIRQQADFWTIEGNIFERNSAPSSNDGETDCTGACTLVNQLTSYESAVIEVFGRYGTVRDNLFQMNQLSCILVAAGSAYNRIEGNTLNCGSRQQSFDDTETAYRASTRDRGFPLVILSQDSNPTGPLDVVYNRFIGQGARFSSENSESTSAPHHSAHVVVTGSTLNEVAATAGGIDGPINFIGNYVRISDSGEGFFTVMRKTAVADQASCAATSSSDGDPDAAKLYFDGNVLNQGNLFGTYESSSYPSFGGLCDLNPDFSGDGIGLASCGSNYIAGAHHTNFEGTMSGLSGSPTVKQCAAVKGNGWAFSDPCSGKPAGYSFYNATDNVPCFCDGAGADVRVDGGAACFP